MKLSIRLLATVRSFSLWSANAGWRRTSLAVRASTTRRTFVRLEITAALSPNIRVIPVLLDGAIMPPNLDIAVRKGRLPDDVWFE